MNAAAVELRPLSQHEEFQRCVELQKIIWGFNDVDVVPLRLFVVASKVGGQVFGAFDSGQMIGFVMAIPGYRHGRSYLHSHMAAVLPDYQGQGIGRRLKLLQREDALERGIELIEWTFDPLAFGNAYFNIERLGAIVRRYVRNQYGRTSSPLHGGLPTDRLVAEWWLNSPRVEAVVRGERVAHPAGAERIIVPQWIHELKGTDLPAAESLQTEVRTQFESWLGRGYAVVGFEHEASGGAYLLEPYQEPR
jgi:predicted GNAT superfamily acetyltransferase